MGSIKGHPGTERDEAGHWDEFIFDIVDTEGDETRFSISDADLPEGFDWDNFFEYLSELAAEYEVDYDNPYE